LELIELYNFWRLKQQKVVGMVNKELLITVQASYACIWILNTPYVYVHGTILNKPYVHGEPYLQVTTIPTCVHILRLGGEKI
jgi:hypothetical protein